MRSTTNNVPVNVVLNEDNVVTQRHASRIRSGSTKTVRTTRDTDFININGGMNWKIGEKFSVDASLNYNHSNLFRSTNTYLFNSHLNTGITVDIDATGDGVINVDAEPRSQRRQLLDLECPAYPARAA